MIIKFKYIIECILLLSSIVTDAAAAAPSTRGFAKQILHIVNNKNALSYFVQFLDTRDALALIKFWLDADSFRIAAAAELSRTNSLPGTPLLIDHHHQQSHPSGHTPRYASRPLLSKSVSLDAFNATSVRCSYDEDSMRLETGSQCTIGSLDDLAEDDEPPTLPDSRCASSISASDRFTPVSNAHSEEVPVEDEATIARRPLTDDEKSHLQLNLRASTKPRNCFQTSLASDAVRIYKKYLTTKSLHSIEIPATHLSAIALALGSTDESTATDCEDIQNIFIAAQAHVLETLQRTQLDDFLQSSFYAKYCVDVLTGERLRIEDILYSDAALFYLMEFLEQDAQRHILEFWVAAANFAKLATTEDGAACDVGQQQSDALVLYDKYFSLQATCPLGLSDRVRGQLEEDICSTCPQTIGRCFERPVAIIERYLDQHYFKAFVTSHLFYRYLSELLHKVDEPRMAAANHPVAKSGHRKTISDCSAEQFQRNISTHNTLLAMDTNPVKRQLATGAPRHKTCPVADMQIDGRLLCDPDMLWARHELTPTNDTATCKGATTSGGLSFGRVDALGRYERDFDLDPSVAHRPNDTSKHNTRPMATTSKFRRVVRKLVNLPEDRAQEEIAWQVAEMIVRDITSVTLNGQPGGTWLPNGDQQHTTTW